MDDHLAPYADILMLLRQWNEGLQQREAPQIHLLRQYEVTEIVEAMSAILVFAEAEMRLTAMEALPYIVPLEAMVDLLVPCLSDARSSIRWSICKLFGQYPDPRATLSMIEVLQSDENPHVRVVAADALCEIGDARALPALLHAAEHDREKNYEGRTVAQAASEAIASIKERMKPS